MIKTFALILTIFPAVLFCGEDKVLDQYIQEALQNNLALKQREFAMQKSLAALREARGLFLPQVSLNARYSRAGGGRDIDIPVGDMVNPIYATLNEILQENRFPTNIANETVPFLRTEEHETKLRIVQPLWQPQIFYNYKIRSKLSEVEKAEKDLFVRALVAEVKTAYFNYLKSLQIVELYEKTNRLLQENLRVSQKLFENQKATQEVVFRARAELSELDQRAAEAHKNQQLASAYFNFLLNAPLERPIRVEPAPVTDPGSNLTMNLEELNRQALSRRDEINQLQQAIAAAEYNVHRSRAALLPALTLVVDYGLQGEKYRLTGRDDFWMGSAVLQWNIFNGYQDQAKIQQNVLERKKLQAQLAELQKQIQLQIQTVYQNWLVAQKSIAAARERLRSAQKSFNIVAKKYRQGMASQIEFIDARTNLTRSEINQIVTEYDLQIRKAELEKAAALFPIEE
ncbi:MAG: TolC family protein [bacterium]